MSKNPLIYVGNKSATCCDISAIYYYYYIIIIVNIPPRTRIGYQRFTKQVSRGHIQTNIKQRNTSISRY